MKTPKFIPMASLMLLAMGTLRAQDSVVGTRPPQGELPPAIKKTARFLNQGFSQSLHFMIDEVASSGGLAAGIGYDHRTKSPWVARINGVVGLHDYWASEARVGFEGRRVGLDAYGRMRNVTRIPVYGSTVQTENDNFGTFDMRDDQAGVSGSYRILSWLTASARAEQMWPRLDGEHLASPIGIRPGSGASSLVAEQPPSFGQYEGALQFDIPGSVGEGFLQGLSTRVSYARIVDQELDKYSFSRVDVEAQQRFVGFRTKDRLTLHGWVSASMADDGQTVPYYLQRTLGGRGHLRSVTDGYLGTDGSQASLRGYDTFRFRGLNTMLLQAEYRVPVWTLFDATLFYDAGKATAERSQLNLTDLHQNYGISMSLMRGMQTGARLDVGFGGDGVQLLLSLKTK